MENHKKVIIYISNFNLIGGVETSIMNFVKVMHKHCDLSLMFDNYENVKTLKTASDYCEVIQADYKTKYDCDVFICQTAWGRNVYDLINAKKYIQIVHADYGYYIKGWNFKYEKHPKITHHVCVGNTVKEAFEKATPYKCDAVVFNFLDPYYKPTKKPKNDKLTLITVSRISSEKGFKRKLQLAKILEENNIDYVWDIYGNMASNYAQNIKEQFKKYPNVIFKGITTTALEEITKADYLVQLSDTEGFCYSVSEALQTKTPCLITPFTSGQEQVKNGVNGYILPFEMDNIPLNEIVYKIPVVKGFKDKSVINDWLKLF